MHRLNVSAGRSDSRPMTRQGFGTAQVRDRLGLKANLACKVLRHPSPVTWKPTRLQIHNFGEVDCGEEV
ncbi:hypothetical protein BQ8794_180015 [Mesorhizobium prunaredense]|uniref:Uncharacterized protein n=1 Tax=Mesorhizobium prunaredense TaxID=1631249 RepID=A0A1R3V451_9HYPH|nr:hypothetical protein BQ8794_180015 [Mesorhizobium prunaredense]